MRTYKARCHPRKSKKNKTCYEENDLIYLRDEWNRKNPSKKITAHHPETIYKKLKKYQQQCKNELCWLKGVDNYEKKQSMMKNNFAILQPKNWKKNEKEWLSNYDISHVLKQYEETHKEFAFIEPSPIDFDTKIGDKCVTEDICKLQLSEYSKKGITKLAIPLNLDKHTGNGFHWVTLYIDIKKGFVYYFDSANNKIPAEVQQLIARLKEQMKLKEMNNQSIQHQKGNTECGMYVLYFIISMLNGKSPTYFNKKIISDNDVFKFREIYFNRED